VMPCSRPGRLPARSKHHSMVCLQASAPPGMPAGSGPISVGSGRFKGGAGWDGRQDGVPAVGSLPDVWLWRWRRLAIARQGRDL
jgi:hypothetical protein